MTASMAGKRVMAPMPRISAENVRFLGPNTAISSADHEHFDGSGAIDDSRITRSRSRADLSTGRPRLSVLPLSSLPFLLGAGSIYVYVQRHADHILITNPWGFTEGVDALRIPRCTSRNRDTIRWVEVFKRIRPDRADRPRDRQDLPRRASLRPAHPLLSAV